MELTLNISAIVAIIGALTVLTNIIVEVLKRATWEKMPTNLLAIIVAMVLTLVAFFGYMARLEGIIEQGHIRSLLSHGSHKLLTLEMHDTHPDKSSQTDKY